MQSADINRFRPGVQGLWHEPCAQGVRTHCTQMCHPRTHTPAGAGRCIPIAELPQQTLVQCPVSVRVHVAGWVASGCTISATAFKVSDRNESSQYHGPRVHVFITVLYGLVFLSLRLSSRKIQIGKGFVRMWRCKGSLWFLASVGGEAPPHESQACCVVMKSLCRCVLVRCPCKCSCPSKVFPPLSNTQCQRCWQTNVCVTVYENVPCKPWGGRGRVHTIGSFAFAM